MSSSSHPAVIRDRSRERSGAGTLFALRPLALERWIIVALGGVGLAAALLFLFVTVDLSLRGSDWALIGLANYREIFLEPYVYRALLQTFEFAGITVFTALIFGAPIAWIAERTDLPARSAIFALMTASLLMPGFFNAMGWLLLLHPRIGMINVWLTNVFDLKDPLFNVVSIEGMGFVQGLGLSSLIFIMCIATFRAMSGALEESAQVHGLGLLARLRTIVIPILWPGILGAVIYTFMLALGLFDVPAIIGLASRIYTYSTFVYSLSNPSASGSPDYGLAAASSILMVVIALMLAGLYSRVVRHSYRYAVVTGKSYKPAAVRLGPWKYAAWAFVGLQLLLSLALPAAVLVWTSLGSVYQPFSLAALADISLDNYRTIDWPVFWSAAANSAIIFFVAPTLSVAISVAIAWTVVRAKIRYVSAFFEMVSFLPLAIPSVVFAVGASALALLWLPSSVPFYGTVAIIVAVQAVIQISFATRVLTAALVQIHTELDEAASVFGLSSLAVLWRILRPLLMPAMVYSWIWIALLCFRELTVSTMLVAQNNLTLPVLIWSLFSSGKMGQAAAITVILALGMLPLLAVFFVLGRRGFSVNM